MAKEIKAIACPKCGSTQKTEIRPDVFRCESCGTEYYLDNDDININYTVRQVPPAVTPPPAPSRVLTGIIAVVALVLVFLFRWLTSSHSPAYPQVVTGAVGPGLVVAESNDKAATYRWDRDESLLYLTPDNRPVLFQVGKRDYEGTELDSSYAVFRDAATGALLRSVSLPLPPSSSSVDFKLKAFSNGDVYVVANQTAVYRVDRAAYTVADVTKSLFAGQRELASGIATITPSDDDDGDGFNVFTNDGKNLNFYPLIHTVYTKDNFYAAQTGFRSLRPGSPTRTAFTFSRVGLTYPDDKPQLIKYQYRDNVGGPKDVPRFEWDDDYGGSGIFTDADPHVKRLITPYELQKCRVLGFSDFTPGRLYFSPATLYADAEYVLISFRPTAAPNSPTSLQCLNARTAAIIFTAPLGTGDSPSETLRYPGGFALRSGDDTHTLSLSGHLTHPKPL